nr:hypothetical protein [uncultured Flavobacterium sp.]
MEMFFKSLGLLIIVLFYISYRALAEKKKTSSRKRDFDSFDEFMDVIYVNPNNIESVKEFINVMRCCEFCKKCKQEKDSKNSLEIKHSQHKINEHIFVQYFRTDAKSWLHLCGREGYIFKCHKHNIDVYKHITCMN